MTCFRIKNYTVTIGGIRIYQQAKISVFRISCLNSAMADVSPVHLKIPAF
jgi:hypothetical protein